MLETVLWFIVGWVVFIWMVWEFSGFSVYGWFIPENKLDKFFEKNLSKYGINELARDSKMFSCYRPDLPFIANSVKSMLSHWYLDDCGRIPVWSKWHRKLYERHAELQKTVKFPPRGIDKYLNDEGGSDEQ